ncbi:DGQHR domain-containing protein [Clostridium perfringens]|uniref:DGQHR domain-containing protein n=1 Tax=Clostridium perfringens TaxID=1502 RepID=UPI0039E7BA00
MKIEVKESQWNGRMCYLGFLKYKDLDNIINVKQDLSMNRQVNSVRVNEICDYIRENKQKVFFPPVILNCSDKINFEEHGEKKELTINNKSLTIIDGQHRISAIIKIMNEDVIFNCIKENEIAFLIIESLKDYEHRDLFNLINERSTNVEATVSARFKISYENLYGLRYIRNNINKFSENLKNLVEWELKQSSEKICYIFITDINKQLLKYINKNIGVINDEENYNVIETFWDIYFEFLIGTNTDIKAFFVKKVVLTTLIYTILDNIENNDYKKDKEIKSYDDLKEKIKIVLNDLLIDSFKQEYDGFYRQTKNTYSEILNYLIDEKNKKENSDN